MRFWLWLTTGMVTKEWVAVHRSHHQFSDKLGDPHSPQVFGIWRVLFGGAFLYVDYIKKMPPEQLDRLGKGTPDDWIEKHLYTPFNYVGIMIMLAIDLLLFGGIGLLIWGIQMIWIPFWAAGVINGLAHWWGYRNYQTRDTARNLIPFGIIIGGEELHNNHHAAAASPKLSVKWFELDIGWLWIKILQSLRLAQLRNNVWGKAA